jgi:hypothetical protein
MSLRASLGLILFVCASGCAATGLGDPCTPEAIDVGGYHAGEVTIETSSAQCRSRVCMVFHLEGDPRLVVGTESCPPGTDRCVLDDASGASAALTNSLDRVFCSCRCGAAGGNASLPLCACGEGFRCVPENERGAGFCVPDAVAIAEGL